MKENTSYKKLIKYAFYLNLVGIVITFTTKGNIAIFGTLLIVAALILAVIAVLKKKKAEKNNS